MFETFKTIKWEKYLRMVGDVKANIGLAAFASGELWDADVEQELVTLHKACQAVEESVWRLWRLSRKDVDNDKEVE